MKYYLVPEESNPNKLVKIGSTQARSGIPIPQALWSEDEADLDISTITDAEGFEQTVITVNEERKAQRIAAENQAKQEREQKESLRSQRKQAEVQKLRSAGLTTEQKVEILWKLAAVDKGVVDLAEDEEGGGKDPGEKMERP